MKLLDRYLMQRFLLGWVPVMILLMSLFTFLELADAMEDVGDGAFTQGDAFRVLWFTTPRRLVDLMPVSLLLAGLFGLGTMANHHELIAARAAGFSRLRLARPVTLLAALLAVAVMVAQWQVVPAAERQAGSIRARTLSDTGVDQPGGSEFWTRNGNVFLRANGISRGRMLTGVEIYATDERSRLTRLVLAEDAISNAPGQWILRRVNSMTTDPLGPGEQQVDQLSWPDLLTPEQAEILLLPPEALSPVDLRGWIRHQEENALDSHRYRMVFWQQLSVPLAMVALAILSLPLLLGSVRAIPAGQRILLGGFIGIAFYLLQQVLGHLASLFRLSPPLMTLLPVLLVLIIAVALLSLEPASVRRRVRSLAG